MTHSTSPTPRDKQAEPYGTCPSPTAEPQASGSHKGHGSSFQLLRKNTMETYQINISANKGRQKALLSLSKHFSSKIGGFFVMMGVGKVFRNRDKISWTRHLPAPQEIPGIQQHCLRGKPLGSPWRFRFSPVGNILCPGWQARPLWNQLLTSFQFGSAVSL